MIPIVNGKNNGAIKIWQGADASGNLLLIADSGVLFDVTGGSVDIVVEAKSDRGGTPIATISCSLVTAASGLCSYAITDTVSDAIAVGNYVGIVKFTATGGDITMTKIDFDVV